LGQIGRSDRAASVVNTTARQATNGGLALVPGSIGLDDRGRVWAATRDAAPPFPLTPQLVCGVCVCGGEKRDHPGGRAVSHENLTYCQRILPAANSNWNSFGRKAEDIEVPKSTLRIGPNGGVGPFAF